MNLGAGALKVEGPIVQKESIALEVTMVTKWVPITRHRHTEKSSVEYLTKPVLFIPIQGWEDWEQKPADITGHDLQWSAKMNKAKQSRAQICNHM